MLLTPILFWMYKLFIKDLANTFQNTFLIKLENGYRRFLTFALDGYKPVFFLGGTFFYYLLPSFNGIFPPRVEFFPENEPQQILILIEYPEGTAIEKLIELQKK